MRDGQGAALTFFLYMYEGNTFVAVKHKQRRVWRLIMEYLLECGGEGGGKRVSGGSGEGGFDLVGCPGDGMR